MHIGLLLSSDEEISVVQLTLRFLLQPELQVRLRSAFRRPQPSSTNLTCLRQWIEPQTRYFRHRSGLRLVGAHPTTTLAPGTNSTLLGATRTSAKAVESICLEPFSNSLCILVRIGGFVEILNSPYRSGTKEHFDPLRECLRSLAFPEMHSRFHDIDTAAKGTCMWLLRHEMYTSWASCDRGLLWIKGKPGSGKSTLLRHALNNVIARPNIKETALILSFFFHGRGTELQKTPLGLFQSLLYQLSQVSDALSDLVATFQQRCETVGKPDEKWQWHPRELQRFFESSLLNILRTRPVWLFVDALDECGKENAVKLVEDFESMLQRPPSSDLKQFRICFTCRHYPILNLDGVFKVCVEKENWKDISTFVQDKLSSFRGRTSATIPDLISKRADGVFLWAWLMVKQVLDLEREGIRSKEIEAKISLVPQKLDALYYELIQNLGLESLKLI